MRAARLGAGLVVVAVVISACTSTPGPPAGPAGSAGPAPTPLYTTYVALGDSFTSGPLIPTTDLAGGCARSDHNYPTFVARELGTEDFTDVSCSGAKTRNLTRPQHPYPDSTIPPQLDAVTAETDLVTLGIGGNDLNLFGTLIRTRRLAANGPDLGAATRTISNRVTSALREIRRRAPEATVVLVGYLRLVPDRATCDRLPLAPGDYAQGRRISLALDRALERAARRTNAAFADAYAASAGHDICADRPWVNGRATNRRRALAYHPFAAGMRAVTREVVAAVR